METVISLNEFSRSIESRCIEFYKTCVLKTNQFSTKYILQKLIEQHKKHIKKLDLEFSFEGEEPLNSGHLENYTMQFSKAWQISAFDIENLNFVEATKLAISLINFQIDFYRQLTEEISGPEFQEIIEKIIVFKTDYIKELESEFERLSYKK